MSFLVTSFYTFGTPYEQEIKNLIQSIDKFKLECDIRGVPSRGDWVYNAGYKPEIILQVLQDNPGVDILFLDADAIIRKRPVLFDNFNGDIGVHYRKDKGSRHLLSGTIFFKNKSEVLTLVSKWMFEQTSNPKTYDQKTLEKTIRLHGQHLRIIDLPPTYTLIFDSMKHLGEPVIEHFQASRRFKRSIKCSDKLNIPNSIGGMRPRLVGDGSFFLPRASRQLLKRMELDFVKMQGELRFYPKYLEETKYFENLRPVFKDKKCYIIGKGPSLDHITSKLFPNEDWPILCMNESIHAIEKLELRNPIFSVQQDHGLGDTCKPKYGNIFVSYRARKAYEGFDRKYIYYPESYKGGRTTLTVLIAINIAISLGTKGFVMIAFDGYTNKDTRYADVIGYNPEAKGSPNRFLGHVHRIKKAVRGLPLSWIKRDPNSGSFDTLLQ